jgi:hypothetical protein
MQLASCWNCGSFLFSYDPEPTTSPTVAEIIDLESAILTAVWGNRLISLVRTALHQSVHREA